jgi:hypothetical protein
VGYDCAHLFIGPDDEPPPDENKPHKWLLDEAAGRLFTAQHALEEARDKLRHLRNAMGQSPAYRHDGAKDVVVAEFLPQMAFAWFRLTGEVPGKTGNGLFTDFCLAAWKTLGWPADDEDRLWAGFVRRIERGEHRRYYPQSSG